MTPKSQNPKKGKDPKAKVSDQHEKKDLQEVVEELDLASIPFEKAPDGYQVEALKKDEKEIKMPVKREDDKRRLGKGLNKFIDDKVSEELLEDMPEEVQELMKK
jgi:hypothetical protein